MSNSIFSNHAKYMNKKLNEKQSGGSTRPKNTPTPPLMNTPPPLMNTPPPLMNTPSPIMNTPSPIMNTPSPIMNTRQPAMMDTPPTMMNTRQPAMMDTPPTMMDTSPSMNPPPSMMNTPPTMMNTPPTMMDTRQPAMMDTPPTMMDTRQPAINNTMKSIAQRLETAQMGGGYSAMPENYIGGHPEIRPYSAGMEPITNGKGGLYFPKCGECQRGGSRKTKTKKHSSKLITSKPFSFKLIPFKRRNQKNRVNNPY